MAIYRTNHNRENPYVMVNRAGATDKRLSFKAKGIWLYAMTRPDGWKFNLQDLINQSTDGRDSVKSGLIELEKAGYLVRSQKRGEDGQLGEAVWDFYEVPQEFKKEVPRTENPSTEKPSTGNRPLVSNEDSKERDVSKRNPLKGVKKERRAKGPPPPPDSENETQSYGEAGKVKMTEAEHSKLESDIGREAVAEYVQALEDYVMSTGKRYRSHFATIRSWYRRDQRKAKVPLRRTAAQEADARKCKPVNRYDKFNA